MYSRLEVNSSGCFACPYFFVMETRRRVQAGSPTPKRRARKTATPKRRVAKEDESDEEAVFGTPMKMQETPVKLSVIPATTKPEDSARREIISLIVLLCSSYLYLTWYANRI